MKSLKNHLSVIFPLFVLLFSIQFSFLTNKIVEDYSRKLTRDYSIVIVASKTIDKAVLKSRVKGIKSIQEISSKKILDRLKDNISSKNISLLKIALPKFYSLKLESFPDISRIEKIKDRLLKSGLVSKVETFSKTHTKIYRMFMLLKSISFLFAAFILIVSVLLMFKQMRIWLLEHKERMAVMTLFGAPFWMKSAMLYRLAIVDSFISTIFVSILYSVLPFMKEVNTFSKSMNITIPTFDILKDGGTLLGISLVFSLFIVSIVISKMNRE
ncbi:FtsX-like permease family protein [Sulfurospirillum arcachonense]|uniref:FtsX-like permease family protein n=1 Tax=Sulfurospirillum arcachonense TaxID=57666 RepID=UPI000468CCCC|nr:FtsX-like permease family protein [Sulfurospirillum arcachonense]